MSTPGLRGRLMPDPDNSLTQLHVLRRSKASSCESNDEHNYKDRISRIWNLERSGSILVLTTTRTDQMVGIITQ